MTGGHQDSLWVTPCRLLHPEEGSPCPGLRCLPLSCLFCPAEEVAGAERLHPAPGGPSGCGLGALLGVWAGGPPFSGAAPRNSALTGLASSPCLPISLHSLKGRREAQTAASLLLWGKGLVPQPSGPFTIPTCAPSTLCRSPPHARQPQSVSLLPRGTGPLFALTVTRICHPEKTPIHPSAPSSSDGFPLRDAPAGITHASSVLARTLQLRQAPDTQRALPTACGGPQAQRAPGARLSPGPASGSYQQHRLPSPLLFVGML